MTYTPELIARARARGATVADPTITGIAANRLCGDETEMRAVVRGGLIEAAEQRTRGCAITSASASLAAERIVGGSIADALALASTFEQALADPKLSLPAGFEDLAPVRLLPARRSCALLPWAALRDAAVKLEP